MYYQTSDIKILRKKYNLTQKDLSSQSGVSQSLIAKIEMGKVEPTYAKMLQLLEVFDNLRAKNEIKAKDLMTKKVLTVDRNTNLLQIITLMKSKNISQIPVKENKQVLGLITESTILENTLKNHKKLNILTAEEIMETSLPSVPLNANTKILLSLLRDYPSVLVMDKGELQGIISKSDLLGRVE